MVGYCPKCGRYSLCEMQDGANNFQCSFKNCYWTTRKTSDGFGDKKYHDLYPLNRIYGEMLNKKFQLTQEIKKLEEDMESIKKIYSEFKENNGEI